ncbi:MAG: response regulator [Gammaproteobacteria bacterium]|nr:response regulator [Gammaproteobacteria bacterium]
MTTGRKILIVEDHKPLRSLLSFLLSNAGYETFETADAMSALDEATRQQPDLVLLDWQLPDMDGIKLLRLWRSEEATAQIPVIMVSGKADEVHRVAGLKAGADDYVTKPFGRDELLARVQAVLRRGGGSRDADVETRRFEGLALDIRSLRVTAGSQPVHLGPIEFKMLNLFITHPERVLTRSQIVDRVWRINAHVDERTVDVHVRRLRLALEPSGHDQCVQTVRGVGYRLSRSDAGAAGAPTDATD